MNNLFIVFMLLNSLLYAEDLYNATHTRCTSRNEIIKIIKNGNIKKLENKIELSCDLYKKNSNGETLIFDAVKMNNENAINLLLSEGFSLYDTNNQGQTLLHVAAKNNFYNIINILMRYGLKDSKDDFGYFAKWYAYHQNSIESLSAIYKNEEKMSKRKDDLDEFIKNFKKKPIDEM